MLEPAGHSPTFRLCMHRAQNVQQQNSELYGHEKREKKDVPIGTPSHPNVVVVNAKNVYG